MNISLGYPQHMHEIVGHADVTVQESLVVGLRSILAPRYVTRAREIANLTETVTTAADLEETAGIGRFG